MNQQEIQQMNPYGVVDQLADESEAKYGGGASGGLILDLIMGLSGILSALYFWKNAALMFGDIPDFISLPLALLCGFAPNELAYFGWKTLRTSKQNMTSTQIAMTAIGAAYGVFGSLIGTMALFITSLSIVPAELVEIRTWLAFLALAAPMVGQVIIIALFAISERKTVENKKRAELGALGFDAHLRFKTAQIAAIIKGQEQALGQLLGGYGQRTGAAAAGNMLDDSARELLNMGQPKRANHPTPATAQTNGFGYNQNSGVTPHSVVRDSGMFDGLVITPELQTKRNTMRIAAQYAIDGVPLSDIAHDIHADDMDGVRKIYNVVHQKQQHNGLGFS